MTIIGIPASSDTLYNLRTPDLVLFESAPVNNTSLKLNKK